jgi:hypothetical protein
MSVFAIDVIALQDILPIRNQTFCRVEDIKFAGWPKTQNIYPGIML